MIKILQLIEDLEVGGAERLVVSLANGLRRDRFRTSVICLTKPGALWDELGDDVERFVLNKGRSIDLMFLWRLVCKIREIGPHIVHTHLFTANQWGRVAAVLAGRVPAVMTIHNMDTWKSALHVACDHLLVPVTKSFVGVSKQILDYAIRHEGVRPARSRVIYNGIDAAAYDGIIEGSCRKEFNLRADNFLFGYVGRLVPQKGVDRLLRVFKYVQAALRDARLIIVGDGPERRKLIGLAEDIGISNLVTFALQRHDVPRLLKDFDCFVLASHREGLPLSLLEAMAAGVPVIATRAGGNSEVVEDGVHGFLVPKNDMKMFAEKMILMAGDKKIRAGMAANARARINHEFSVDMFLRRTERLYMELV